MSDRELVLEDLRHIEWSLKQIMKRFASVTSSDDFMKDDDGLEKLDSIRILRTSSSTAPHPAFGHPLPGGRG